MMTALTNLTPPASIRRSLITDVVQSIEIIDAIIEIKNKQNESPTNIFHFGFVNIFSRNVTRIKIEPVLSVVKCL